MYCLSSLGMLFEVSSTVWLCPVLGSLFACLIHSTCAVNVLSLDSRFLEASALTARLTCGACKHLDIHPPEACLETAATQGPSHRGLVPLEGGLFHDGANVCQIWKESRC